MRSRRRDLGDDEGAALVEFLGITAMILVPVIYVVIAASQLQAATFAVEGASRAGARGAVVAALDVLEHGGSPADARAAAGARAEAAVEMALEDFAVRGEPVVTLACDTDPCFEPDSAVTATVSVDVPLAGVPSTVIDIVPATVNVTAVGRSPVEGFSP